MKSAVVLTKIKRRRVALLIESSRAYGRGLLLGVAKYVRTHHEWTVQSEEWRWTDPTPEWLRLWDGDGIIARIETPELAEIIQNLGIPAVDVRGSIPGFQGPLMDTNDQAVAVLAAEHLIERGFKHYAFCGFPGANYSEKRSQSFLKHLKSRGFDALVYTPREESRDAQTIEYERDGLMDQAHLAYWLETLPKPVGIMTCNDIRGQQVMNLCSKLDLAIPEEVALIGVDNDEVLCELSDPPLSSVMPDTIRIGYEAAGLLEKMMCGRKPPARPVYVPPLGIIARRSTDVLAMEDKKLAKGVRFLRDHAFEPLSIDEVALAAGMARRVFERRFSAQMGRAPNAEVLRLRLERAKQLLTDTGWSLAEIAERTGFNHAEYFHSVFTKKTGLTPGKYRLAQKAAGYSNNPQFNPHSKVGHSE